MATWEQRIDAAETHGGFTDDDRKATVWNQCAVGEQRKAYPRVIECVFDEPIDPSLNESGYAFAEAVYANNPREARKILKKIERRVQTLARRKSKEA